MKIETMSRKQTREEVKKEVEKREYKILRLIESLNKRISTLEETLHIQKVVRRLGK